MDKDVALFCYFSLMYFLFPKFLIHWTAQMCLESWKNSIISIQFNSKITNLFSVAHLRERKSKFCLAYGRNERKNRNTLRTNMDILKSGLGIIFILNWKAISLILLNTGETGDINPTNLANCTASIPGHQELADQMPERSRFPAQTRSSVELEIPTRQIFV